MAVQFQPGAAEAPVRVAYAVGRRFGGAVERNRCRRQLRAVAGEITGDLPAGDYLIGVRPGEPPMTFRELRDRVLDAMLRASR